MQACVSECNLTTLRSPIPELQHAPLPLKVLWARERVPPLPSSVVFYLDSHLSPSRSWECVKRATGNTNTQDSPWPKLGGSYHLPPYYCNPTLAKCGGEAQHLEKLGIWSPPRLPNVQSSTARPKTPHIGVLLVSLEKVLKRKYRKWPRIGHLDIFSPKLWAKEGSGVKLAVWLPTTKSRESMPSRHPIWECDIALKSSQQGL